MKLLKKIAPILLFLAIALIPVSVLAAHTVNATVITSIKLTDFAYPVDGEMPLTNFCDTAGQHVYVSSVQWRRSDGASFETFENNERYYVRFVLTPQSGYTFPSTLAGFTELSLTKPGGKEEVLDRDAAYLKDGKLHLETICVYASSMSMIGAIDVNGFAVPEPGGTAQTADELSVPSHVHYRVVGLEYRPDTDFTRGKQYYAGIYLKSDYGYRFPDQIAGDFAACRINGGTKLVDMDHGRTYEDGKYYLFYTKEFYPTETVSYVNVMGLVKPAAGARPQEMFVSPVAVYTLSKFYWYNATDGNKMNSADVFEIGKMYYVQIELTPNTGYVFADESAFTGRVNIDGTNAAVDLETVYISPDLIRMKSHFYKAESPVNVEMAGSYLNVTGLPEGVRALITTYEADGRFSAMIPLMEDSSFYLGSTDGNVTVFFVDGQNRPVLPPWKK